MNTADHSPSPAAPSNGTPLGLGETCRTSYCVPRARSALSSGESRPPEGVRRSERRSTARFPLGNTGVLQRPPVADVGACSGQLWPAGEVFSSEAVGRVERHQVPLDDVTLLDLLHAALKQRGPVRSGPGFIKEREVPRGPQSRRSYVRRCWRVPTGLRANHDSDHFALCGGVVLLRTSALNSHTRKGDSKSEIYAFVGAGACGRWCRAGTTGRGGDAGPRGSLHGRCRGSPPRPAPSSPRQDRCGGSSLRRLSCGTR